MLAKINPKRAMGKSPSHRVKALLGKLDSVRRSEEGGYEVSTQAKLTSHKFMGSVEEIFKNLPNPMKWQYFYLNALPLLMGFFKEVWEALMQYRLNRSLNVTNTQYFRTINFIVIFVYHDKRLT